METSMISQRTDYSRNTNLERDLIRKIFLEPGIIYEVSVLVNPDVFTDEKCRAVYRILLNMNEQEKPIDSVTAFSELTKSGYMNTLISPHELGVMVQGANSAANFIQNCRMLLEYWMKRQIVRSARATIERTEFGEDVFDIITSLAEDIYSIENNIIIERDRDVYTELPNLIYKVEQKYSGNIPEGLKSQSFPSLNKATGGIMQTDFVVVYGKEKSAKTTWAMRLALDFAFQNIPIAIFTLEMNFESSAYKALSMECGVEYLKLRNPKGQGASLQELQEFAKTAHGKFENVKIFIDDTTFDFEKIIGKMKIMKRKYNIGLFMIDYLGLIECAKKFEARRLEIKHYSRRLKNLTKELNTPIVAICQANDQEKTAESVDPLRDCDFAIRCSKPLEDQIKSIKVGQDENYNFTEDDFFLTVERSRHGKNKQTFICHYDGTKFVERDISIDHEAKEIF